MIVKVVICVLTVAMGQTPMYPVYAPQWTAVFTETVIGSHGVTHNTTGTTYYDWTNLALRVDRTTAAGDTFCALNGLARLGFDGECRHYVSNGERFIYYPEDDECCYCCSDSNGCGMLQQDWLSDATFLGQEEHNGVQTYKWDQKGSQDNYYYETVAADPLAREIVSVYQWPNDLQDFTNYSHSFPSSALTIPASCSRTHRCPLLSWCTVVVLGSLFR